MECSQLHFDAATLHTPALTSSGRFEYLLGQASLLLSPRNAFLGAKGTKKSQTITALPSHFVAATICYGFFLFFSFLFSHNK